MRERPDQEMRHRVRTRRSSAVFWRTSAPDDFHMGWLLEASEAGFAFAWRGDDPPEVGAEAEIEFTGELAHLDERAAIVRRVERSHDDLYIIAAEIQSPASAVVSVQRSPNVLGELRRRLGSAPSA